MNTVEVDDLPPTQYLILEVLAARHRLGERWWRFPTRLATAARALETAGLVQCDSAPTPHHIRVGLTELGVSAVLDAGYNPPTGMVVVSDGANLGENADARPVEYRIVGWDQQMVEALRRQRGHAAASHQVDRRGWSTEQWVEDARQLMGDVDGSVMDLVNGHVIAMLARVRQLEADKAKAIAQHDGARVELADAREAAERREALIAQHRQHLASCIWVDPGRQYGRPCLGGTRIPADLVAEAMAYGWTGDRIRESYPDVTDGHLAAVQAWQRIVEAERRDAAAELAQARADLLAPRAANAGARQRLAEILRSEQHGLAEMVDLVAERVAEQDALVRRAWADALDLAARCVRFDVLNGAAIADLAPRLRRRAAEVRDGTRTISPDGGDHD